MASIPLLVFMLLAQLNDAKYNGTFQRLNRLSRGGGRWTPPPIYELNPNYVGPYGGKHISGGEQLGDEDSFYIETQTFSIQQEQRRPSIYQSIQEYLGHLRKHNPELFATFVACTGVFMAWQIPACQGLLHRHFLCSRRNVGKWPHSMLLSAVSHNDLLHLAFNLLALLSLGPRVQQALQRTSTNLTTALWPLLTGAALSGNICFMLFSRQGSCMGLSGVTMSLLAVYAKFYPDQTLRMLLAGVIPIRMPAHQLLQVAIAGSFLGTVALRSSRIAHSAHLGGLIFGVGYFEALRNKRRWRARFEELWSKPPTSI